MMGKLLLTFDVPALLTYLVQQPLWKTEQIEFVFQYHALAKQPKIQYLEGPRDWDLLKIPLL